MQRTWKNKETPFIKDIVGYDLHIITNFTKIECFLKGLSEIDSNLIHARTFGEEVKCRQFKIVHMYEKRFFIYLFYFFIYLFFFFFFFFFFGGGECYIKFNLIIFKWSDYQFLHNKHSLNRGDFYMFHNHIGMTHNASTLVILFFVIS